MARKCLKCGHERLHTDSSPNFECPNCGAIYAKVEAALKKNTNNESLTDEELEITVLHLQWEQQHRVFDNTNMYRSRSYYAYRSGNWIGWIYEIQAKRRKN